MNAVDITLQDITFTQFFKTDNTFLITINFKVNNELKSYENRISLNDPDVIAEKLIKEIKSRFEVKAQGRDFLDNLVVARVKNIEETTERLSGYIRRVADKVKMFKHDKQAEGYLNRVASFDKICMRF